jgi:hypothetical protein
MDNQTHLETYGDNDGAMNPVIALSPDKAFEILELDEGISKSAKVRSPLRLTAIMTALYVRFYPLSTASLG